VQKLIKTLKGIGTSNDYNLLRKFCLFITLKFQHEFSFMKRKSIR